MEVTGKCREERGEVALHLSIVLLVGVLLFSAALSIHHVYTVINRVIDKTNEAVLSVAASNVAEIYRGVRESDGAARRYTEGAWTHAVSTSAVVEALGISLGAAAPEGGLLVSESFLLHGLDTRFVNRNGANLNFTTSMRLEIPLSFGGGLLPHIQLSLEVNTTYEPKFEQIPFSGAP